ncbi:MAG: methyltransferase family protein [Ignavibacteriaceae bacterium]
MIRIFVWIIMIVGGAALGLWLDTILFKNIHISIVFHSISFVIGFLLMVLVIKISKNTGRTLAKYGRKGNLKRMETNVLVNQGAYKYMRHPMHLGLLLFPLSIAFLIGSPSFILLIAPAEIIFMLIMIQFMEEPEAIKKFGKEYLEYKNQLPWFCFKIKCLKELFKRILV